MSANTSPSEFRILAPCNCSYCNAPCNYSWQLSKMIFFNKCFDSDAIGFLTVDVSENNIKGFLQWSVCE